MTGSSQEFLLHHATYLEFTYIVQEAAQIVGLPSLDGKVFVLQYNVIASLSGYFFMVGPVSLLYRLESWHVQQL